MDRITFKCEVNFADASTLTTQSTSFEYIETFIHCARENGLTVTNISISNIVFTPIKESEPTK